MQCFKIIIPQIFPIFIEFTFALVGKILRAVSYPLALGLFILLFNMEMSLFVNIPTLALSNRCIKIISSLTHVFLQKSSLNKSHKKVFSNTNDALTGRSWKKKSTIAITVNPPKGNSHCLISLYLLLIEVSILLLTILISSITIVWIVTYLFLSFENKTVIMIDILYS